MDAKRLNSSIRYSFSTILLVISLLLVGAPQTFANDEPQLSAEDKIEIFEKVWTLVNERYYDPNMNGTDWAGSRQKYLPEISAAKTDLEYYDVVKKMVGELNDAHTRFLTPREARERRSKQGTTAGILLSSLEGKTVVEKVLPQPLGDLGKVKPGMIVRTIDGVRIEKLLDQVKNELGGSSSERSLEIMSYRRILRGEPGTKVSIGLTDKNGKDLEVTLIRQVVPEESEALGMILPSGLGYINVTSFKSPIADKFENTLLELKNTPAIIIDLRYNGGGSISEVLEMAGVLLNRKYNFGQFMTRKDGTKQSLKKFSAGNKGGQIYSKPLIILTSKYSASGSELFASGLQELGRAKVIGSQTCGCLLGISRRHSLKDGSELHISDIGFISAKGNIYEKVGVTPDKIVKLTVKDLENEIDRHIEEAENIFSKSV